MKIKTRPKHAGMLQVKGWLAGLRDGESATPADLGNLESCDPGPGDPRLWASRPVALQDRDMGLSRTAWIPAAPSVGTAGGAALPNSRNLGRAGRGFPPLSQAELEWHHDYQADEAHPRWQISRKPSHYIHSPAVAMNPARAR